MGIKAERRNAFMLRRMERQGGRCYWCDVQMVYVAGGSTSPVSATIDHVIPKAKGGSEGSFNKVLSCLSCNNLKGSIPVESWAILISKGIESARVEIERHKARQQRERRYIPFTTDMIGTP
jgi:hypothetical protein